VSNPYNVLFFELENGTFARFFFDGGVFFWRSEAPSTPDSFEGNSFRLTEPDSFRLLSDRTITAVRFEGAPGAERRLEIAFGDSCSLEVQNHHNHRDETVVAVTGGRNT